MTVFAGATTARTMDFEEGDVGYVPISNPHYIENTGDSDLVFIEMFKTSAAPAGKSASRSDDVDAR
jgi:oxalate decarboxylase